MDEAVDKADVRSIMHDLSSATPTPRQATCLICLNLGHSSAQTSASPHELLGAWRCFATISFDATGIPCITSNRQTMPACRAILGSHMLRLSFKYAMYQWRQTVYTQPSTANYIELFFPSKASPIIKTHARVTTSSRAHLLSTTLACTFLARSSVSQKRPLQLREALSTPR
jgi:hypothetical protein